MDMGNSTSERLYSGVTMFVSFKLALGVATASLALASPLLACSLPPEPCSGTEGPTEGPYESCESDCTCTSGYCREIVTNPDAGTAYGWGVCVPECISNDDCVIITPLEDSDAIRVVRILKRCYDDAVIVRDTLWHAYTPAISGSSIWVCDDLSTISRSTGAIALATLIRALCWAFCSGARFGR